MTEDHVVEDQSEAAAFLCDPATHGGHPVERIDTHGAMVFLAGDRAYKVKRAVAFPYMDYSTLERRRAACRAEVRLNCRTAPEFYLGVIPIIRGAKGRLRFGRLDQRRANAVEWAVVMRRFAQSSILNHMARDGRLTAKMMRELAEVIAAFHQEAEPRRDFAATARIRAVVAENFAELAREPALFEPGRLTHLRQLTGAALDRTWSLLCDREQAGLVRRCHGDLHLRNICLIDGRPMLFDAIEFNDGFAIIDVLYDLAFLLMDLDHRGLAVLANALANQYLGATLDYAGLASLPLFLSMRAAVRAKVAVSSAAVQTDPSAASEWRREACRFFDRAVAYVDVPPPRLIAIGGLSGTGKSTLARELAPSFAPAPGAVILRSDVIRKHLAGVAETARLPADNYRPSGNRRVYREIARRAGQALGAGYPVIVDAVYAKPKERAAIEAVARNRGVGFDGLWLDADSETMLHRIDSRTGDASDATKDVARGQLGADLGRLTWTRIDAAASLGEVVATSRRCLHHPARRANQGDLGATYAASAE